MSEVHVVLPDGSQVLAGTLDFDLTPAGTLAATRFTYSAEYLTTTGTYALCPELPMTPRPMTAGRLFGCFQDAQPDSWGRHLLQIATRHRGGNVTTMTEESFLLDVHDETRLGALRFRERGTFQAPAEDGVPTLVSIDRLVAAAQSTTRGTDDPEGMALLLAAGSSMGGARPKATVRDADGTLHVAKFPALDDRWDVQRWERITLRLAEAAGISVPESRFIARGPGHGVLLLQRFDRVPHVGSAADHHGGSAGSSAPGLVRVGYMSAATLLQHEFGGGDRPDYVSLSEDLQALSHAPEADAHELFRRVAFTLLVRNTDDHMRNHALLRGSAVGTHARHSVGWRLSPAFDINPQPLAGIPLAPTPIDFDDADGPDRDIRRLVKNATNFRLTHDDATVIVREVEQATSRWTKVALREGADPEEFEFFAKAFENPNRERARSLSTSHEAR